MIFRFVRYNASMGRPSKSDIRFRRVKRLFRVHAWVTGAVCVSYALLAFVWGPSFSISDFRETWSSSADDVVVSAIVPPPPSAPIVVAEAVCPVSTLFVSLEWDDDSGATSFDVYRDSALLVSGLVDSEYDDTSVLASTTYSYAVVAYGPMDPGVASSVAVSVTTPSGCLELLTPTLDIVTVAGMNVTGQENISVSDTMPTITGTSNMPTASVEISIVGTTSTFALLATNGNGFWEWTPTSAIAPGNYTLTVTVTHPLFPLQTASDTMMLTILAPEEDDRDGGDDNDDGKKKKKNRIPRVPFFSSVSGTIPLSERVVPEAPLPPRLIEGMPHPPFALLSIDVINIGNTVFQSRTLDVSLSILDLQPSFDGRNGEVVFTILDPEHQKVFSVSQERVLRKGVEFREAIRIPRDWSAGDYLVSARLRLGETSVAAEAPFRVVDLPLFDVGGGMLITWNDATRFLGWASLWSLLFFLLLLLLFAREYWLFLYAREHITERDLPGHGFFRSEKGKEVQRL